MAFPTISITDNFNRTEDPLSTGWQNLGYNSATLGRRLTANGTQALAQAASAFSSSVRTATIGPDSEVYVQIPTKSADGTELVVLFLRLTGEGANTADTAYYLEIDAAVGTDGWILGKILNNAFSTLQTGTQEMSAGDWVGFEVLGTGATVTLNGYRCPSGSDQTIPANWTQVITITDVSGTRIVGSGRAAVELQTNVARLDNWADGTTSAGTTPSMVVARRAERGLIMTPPLFS